ncbi:hypothetical protein PsYK624_007090 [Phanerochaete sordida]|uniref:Uncharacterized protein n=1 Tax=Phanerochaete sordida TaxID=48140 RepID=A0A9P3FWZ8_9APHY|nr:hypothetical protein PsYK624_007090 [Phanerochaete sordida]
MPLSLAQRASRYVTRPRWHSPAPRRPYSTEQPQGRPRSAYATWYTEMLPGMVPVALLGSAVYVGLRFLQASLSHERFLDEARARVQELEREIAMLREQQSRGDVAQSVLQGAGEEETKRSGWLW